LSRITPIMRRRSSDPGDRWGRRLPPEAAAPTLVYWRSAGISLAPLLTRMFRWLVAAIACVVELGWVDSRPVRSGSIRYKVVATVSERLSAWLSGKQAFSWRLQVTGVAGFEPATYGFGDRRSTN
jgi:hypothetical protein